MSRSSCSSTGSSRPATSLSSPTSARAARAAGPSSPDSDSGKPDHDPLRLLVTALGRRSPRGRRRGRRRARAPRAGVASVPAGIRAARARCGASRDRRRAPGAIVRISRRGRRLRRQRPRALREQRASASSTASAFGPPPTATSACLPVPPPSAFAASAAIAPAVDPRSTRSLLTATATAALSPSGVTPDEADDARAERVARRDRQACAASSLASPSRRSTTTPSTAAAASVPRLGDRLPARARRRARSRSCLASRRAAARPARATSAGADLEQRRGVAQRVLLVADVRERAVAGDRLDATEVRADRALAHDLDRADEAERVHVRAAAQLDRVLPGLEHAHEVAVLVAEERDRAEALGVVLRGLVVAHRRVGDAPRRWPGPRPASSCSGVTASKWLKSKRSRSGATSEPACLHVRCRAPRAAPSAARASRCGCGGSRSRRSPSIARRHLVALGDRAARRPRSGARRARGARTACRATREHAPSSVVIVAGVADLPARLGVERRAVEHDLDACRSSAAAPTRCAVARRAPRTFAPTVSYSWRPVNSVGPISSSSSRYTSVGAAAVPPAALCAPRARGRAARAIRALEAVEVDAAPALLRDLAREVDREAERVVEEERVLTARRRPRSTRSSSMSSAALERLAEPLLLALHGARRSSSCSLHDAPGTPRPSRRPSRRRAPG